VNSLALNLLFNVTPVVHRALSKGVTELVRGRVDAGIESGYRVGRRLGSQDIRLRN